MSQTLALLLDAYRDLNSRKLFWTVLILSTLVAASFGLLALTPSGYELLFWKFHSEYFNSTVVPVEDLYNNLFVILGMNVWLTWAATILALISTGGMFPDFISTGGVDLYLSKPIGRLRLFATKYFFGLLFTAIQIACFCAASFLVIGLRAGLWEPGIFLAVPLVVLFFSYLFSVCVLLGVWTRSTVAAVLLTLLFWVGLFCVHRAELWLLWDKIYDENHVARLDHQISKTEASLDAARQKAVTRPTTRNDQVVDSLSSQLAKEQKDRADGSGGYTTIHEILYITMTVLPKTSETIDLQDRTLISMAHLERAAQMQDNPSDDVSATLIEDEQINIAREKELRMRSVGWIIGTSLTFEFVVISLAAWVFCRRDY